LLGTSHFILVTGGLFHLLFFFNDPAPTELYPLSLHDALPISRRSSPSGWDRNSSPSAARSGCSRCRPRRPERRVHKYCPTAAPTDRKSTRLNSSHSQISYAVFCLKKKKTKTTSTSTTTTNTPT